MKHTPDTQIEAYERTQKSSFCKYERDEIIRLLKENPDGLTPRELAEKIKGVQHVYSLRPRITELKKDGVIINSGRRKDYLSKMPYGRQIVSREMVLVLNDR